MIFALEAVLMPPGEHSAPDSVLADPLAVALPDQPGLRLLYRLQTNQDWLRPPLRIVPRVPLGVAYSIKGGVGRSTAFAMLALALARQGKRVVVIDLDLEAPGIGPLLLGSDLPALGLVDWLAEALVEAADSGLLPDVVLLDTRAGLHDIGAAAITQLGAQVFLFARDEAQNWEAYAKLLEHLRSSPQIGTADENDDLRSRLKLCAAMMENLGESLEFFGDNAYETFLEIYDAEDTVPFPFARNAEEAPHYPLPVAFSAQMRGRNFIRGIEADWSVIFPAFESFVSDALLDDLDDLAVLSRAAGGRINMPDIFRVAAGIKRRGGVPPAR